MAYNFEQYLSYIINNNYFTEVMDNHIINLITKNDHMKYDHFNGKHSRNYISFIYFRMFYNMS